MLMVFILAIRQKILQQNAFKRLTFQEALTKELGVMDLAAFCQCRDHHMKIRVFSVLKPGALLRIVTGEEEGTLVEGT